MTDSAMASRHMMRKAVTTAPDFYTVFGAGLTIGAPTWPAAKHVQMAITGTDAVTGYADTDLSTLYGTNTNYRFWGIGNMPNATDMDADPEQETYFTQTITTPADPIVPGGRQLTNACLLTELGSNPQTHLYVGIQSAAALAGPIESCYWEMDFILPAGLDLQTINPGTGKFWVGPLEIKTGAYYDDPTYYQAVGDFRVKVGLTGASGGVNRWQVICDNEANGRGVIPELSIAPYDSVYEYVNIINTDETVLLNTRTNIKIWYKSPSGPEDLTTGRLRIDVKPEGYDAFSICDITSGYQLCGEANLPITRLFFGSNYTSASPLPFPSVLESLAIYNNPTDSLLNSLFR